MRFFLIFFPFFLFADISYFGSCGNYDYNLTIQTDKYFGGMCVSDQLLVYNDKRQDEIQKIYADPQYSSSFDIYDPQNYKVLDSFDVNDYPPSYIRFTDTIITKRDIYEILFGVSGLIVAMMFSFVFLRGFDR